MNFCARCGTRMQMNPSTREFFCPNCIEEMVFHTPRRTDEKPTITIALDSYIHDEEKRAEERSGEGSRPPQPRITEDDIFLIPTIRRMMEQEISHFQRVFEYAQDRYDDECQEWANECPDHLDGLEPDLYYKQVYTWFVCEKALPQLGNRTVLEEFVARRVFPKDRGVAQRMLLARNPIRGSFRVLDASHHPYILVEHLETGSEYLALTKADRSEASRRFVKGGVVIGKIRPWWKDRYYMFDGIISTRNSGKKSPAKLRLITPSMIREIMESLDDYQTKRYESIHINSGTTLQSAINKYPSEWVDAMCSAVGIDIRAVRTKSNKARAIVSKLEGGYAEELLRSTGKLGQKHIAALRMLAQNDWVVRYGQLTKRFSSETGFEWNEHPPKSELGVLKLHGLLVVGRMPERGRLYKVALVPLELRAAVKRMLLLSLPNPTANNNMRSAAATSKELSLPDAVKDYILKNILVSTAMTPDDAVKAVSFQFKNDNFDVESLFLAFRTIAMEKKDEIERTAVDSIPNKNDMMWYLISDPKGRFGLVVDGEIDRIIHISIEKEEATSLLQLLNKGIGLVGAKPKSLFVLGQQQEIEALQNTIGSEDVVDVEMLPNAVGEERKSGQLAHAVTFMTARFQSIRDYIYDFVALWEPQMKKERNFTDTGWLPYIGAHFYNMDGPNADGMKKFDTFVYDLLMFQDLLTGEHSFGHAGETLNWDDSENVNRWFQGIQAKIEKHPALPKLMEDGGLLADGYLGTIVRLIGPPYSAKDSVKRYWFVGVGSQVDYGDDYLPAMGEKPDAGEEEEEEDTEMTFFIGAAVSEDKEAAVENALANARRVLDQAREVNAANQAEWLVTTFNTQLFEKYSHILGEGIRVKYAPPG